MRAVSLNFGFAQEEPTDPPHLGNDLDSLLINVDQTSVTSGITYERTTQFANLYNFNRPASDEEV
jgi:hypothetical protein